MSNSIHSAIPTILFGAFDRHNFGDLLFPHLLAALLDGEELLFAGLQERDLSCYGGHRVRAVTQLAVELGTQPVRIIHAGGELLTCDAWQAAVMLLPSERVGEVVAHFDLLPHARLEWARTMLGVDALAPYTLSRRLFPATPRVIYNAVGGVELGASDAALRAEVLVKLKAADGVSVRERQTQALLESAGIPAQLVPDPAVMVAELFGGVINDRARQGEVAELLAAFPQSYIAVQFSAGFGDDESLAIIAAQLDLIATRSGYGVVLFRAGAAPWHDDLECYRRLAPRLRSGAVRIFSSLNLWDICAVIAHSHGYCGSSLHGRILAMAFALPRVNFHHSVNVDQPTKQAAFADTWEVAAMPAVVEVHGLAAGMEQALAVDPLQLHKRAEELATIYRRGFAELIGSGPLAPR